MTYFQLISYKQAVIYEADSYLTVRTLTEPTSDGTLAAFHLNKHVDNTSY